MLLDLLRSLPMTPAAGCGVHLGVVGLGLLCWDFPVACVWNPSNKDGALIMMGGTSNDRYSCSWTQGDLNRISTRSVLSDYWQASCIVNKEGPTTLLQLAPRMTCASNWGQ